jgi:tetraacyldisaccharide 4'-kinase
MPASSEQFFRDVISGRRRGAGAALLRGTLALGEPFYAMTTALRNWCYERRVFPSDPAPRPVICVGNITTGGTGKTPVVRWLADRMRQAGHRPAILMRGYKGTSSTGSDEQRLLTKLLEDESLHRIPVIANPNRLAGAQRALQIDPHIDVFILDDGFQHRKLRRAFDLVLIDSTNPFGHGHQLPRGLLRESLRGLTRAGALLLTHVESVGEPDLQHIERSIRRYNAFAPIYHCRHALRPPEQLHGKRFFLFCGIGNPQALQRQVDVLMPGSRAGSRFFGDHHAYREDDLIALESAARAAGADVLATTGKDLVKLDALGRANVEVPVVSLPLEIEFRSDDDAKLLDQISAMVGLTPSPQR